MRTARKTRPAFTLIEILVCVIILGIAAMAIVPQIGTRGDLKVAAASRVVMADLIYAQNRAISLQTRQYVRCTVSTNTYDLLSSISPVTYLTHPINLTNYTQKFGAGGTKGFEDVTLYSASFGGQTVLSFDELGVPYSYDSGTGTSTALTASGTMVLKCGSFELTISIEPDTGNITVQ